jgi:ABC-2 type transport system ATP-binding protein
VLAELERVADYLILLSAGRVQLAGEADDLLAGHPVLTGPSSQADTVAKGRDVVHVRHDQGRVHVLVRANSPDLLPPGWETHPASLEELTLAYLRQPGAAAPPRPPDHRNFAHSEATK